MGAWIGNVVYDLPWGNDLKGHAHEIRAVATLYSELLGLRNESRADMHREFNYEGGDEFDEIDPLLCSLEPDGIGLAFEYDKRGLNRMPRWPDPGYPQQVHIDVFVDDLDAAEGRVVKLGAVKVRDAETHRTYMDQVGHPFCLYVHEAGGWPGVLGRIVFDCERPEVSAQFYGELLDMPTRIVQTTELILIARADGRLPMLGFQRSASARHRWPDPLFPQQVHLDLRSDEPIQDQDVFRAKLRERAIQLGAVRQVNPPGHDHVYADPAGHLLCM